MKIIILTFLIHILCVLNISAQNFERCASHTCATHKNIFFNSNYEKVKSNKQKNFDEIITVPVVVHVLHNETNGIIQGANISLAQINSQIERLNTDFAANNIELTNVPTDFVDVTAFDGVGIQFRLAEIDPDGNATNGITRTYTEKESFSFQDDDIKRSFTGGADAWPRNDYINIWVAPSINNGGALGYAQFPNSTDDPLTDGLVVAYNYFGDDTGEVNPFNSGAYYKGRTLVHEMGHFFGLTHIWGNDDGSCISDDGVIDTPTQGDSYYGCPDEGTASCNSLDMFMNYMDYTDDECMYLFSQDQAERMYEVLTTNTTRIGLVEAGQEAFEECVADAGTILSPSNFEVCFSDSTENLEILGGNENYETIWVITQPNGTVEGYQLGENVSFANYEAAYYGVTHINCASNDLVEIFDLIDSDSWNTISLNNALNDAGLCAKMQTFGYPIFTQLAEGMGSQCTTNFTNIAKNITIEIVENTVFVKGIAKQKLIDFAFFTSNSQLIKQETTDNFQSSLPAYKGLLYCKISTNQHFEVIKILNY